MTLLQENLEFGFTTERGDISHLKAPLVGQLASFKEFGQSTRTIETAATGFGGERVLRGVPGKA